MLQTQSVLELVAGMITNIFSTFSELGGKYRRLLSNEPREASGTRSNGKIEDLSGHNAVTKSSKITSEEHDLQWLGREGLESLVSRYRDFCHCFSKACSILHGHQSRTKANKLLKPLLPVLVNNDLDPDELRMCHDNTDACKLWFCLCNMMMAYLDNVYEQSKFIKMKGNYAKVPKTWPIRLSPLKLEKAARIEMFLSAPNLFVVLKRILELSNDPDDLSLPADMIDRVVLDMAALQHNIVLPSFVQSEHFYQRLLEKFPPPRRLGQDYVGFDLPDLPGTLPDDGSGLQDINAVDHAKARLSSLFRHDSPPSLMVRKGSAVKTRMRAALFTAQKAVGDSQSKKHREQHHKFYDIKGSYAANLKEKKPLTTAQIRVAQSILKNRKKTKRLAVTRAPKRIRSPEPMAAPVRRAQLGSDVRRRFRYSGRSIKPVLTRKVKPESPSEEQDYPLTRRVSRRVGSDVHRPESLEPRPLEVDEVDLSLAIEGVLSLPSIELLAISDDTKTGIAIKKEKAALQARELATKQAFQERKERLAKSGGLRVPEQPLVPTLLPNWHARAQATLRAPATTTLATTGEGIDLRRHDFATVVPPCEWLNDEIVNGSLNWLDQFINSAAGIKDVKKSTRRCLSLSSFFFKRLQEQGVTKTQRALRRCGVDKKNILDVDTVLLPICEHLHWTLLVIRPSKRTIAHMDSLNPRGSQSYINLGLAWLRDILEESFLEDEWKVMQHKAPSQTNGYDCGVHTITNGMCVALGLSPIDSYGTEDMPRQRVRLACMLLNGGFKGDFDLRVY